jgi:hypothetical protein
MQEENTAFSAQIEQHSAQSKQQSARISELELRLVVLHERNLQLEIAVRNENKQTLRIAELEQQLSLIRSQKVSVGSLDTNDPSVFEEESLERLKEWKCNIEYCIDQAEDREEEARLINRKKNNEQDMAFGRNAIGKVEQQKKKTVIDESVLPFSQLGLSGYLNRNHRLTQKYTEYPEPRPKGEEKGLRAKKVTGEMMKE